MTGWIAPLFLIGLLGALAPAMAWLLRRAGFPGGATSAAIAGGLMVGIVLGPSIFGRVQPILFNTVILGAAEESQELRLIQRENGAELVVAEYARWGHTQLQELRARHERELTAPRATLAAATRSHQAPLRAIVLVLVAIILLAMGSQSVRTETRAGFWLSAVNIGLASAALPGAIAFLIAVKLWNTSMVSAAVIAAALAIGPAALRPEERIDADAAELGGAAMLQAAARLATLIAMLALGVALFAQGQRVPWWGLTPMLALPAAWLIAALVGPRLYQIVPLVRNMAVPVIAAITVLNLDLFHDAMLWPMVVILLFSDDGRGLGSMLGAMLPGGRRSLRGLRLALGTVAAGSTQLAVTVVGAQAGLIPPWATLPLLLGVLLIEATSGLRRRLSSKIGQLERTLPHHDSDRTA